MTTRREPYLEKSIKEIALGDYKVALSGFVVNKTADSFLLDDGEGNILVRGGKAPEVDFVKVFGRVMSYGNGFELQADLIQDYSKVDKDLLKRVKELLRRA